MAHTAAVAATCTSTGNIEYGQCTVCNKYFGDADGTTEITLEQMVTVKTAHTLSHTTATGATCTEHGFTGDTYCTLCGIKLSSGSDTDALGHTGGVATCNTKAVCTRCSQEYGAYNAENHSGGTEVKNARAATETEEGYTGDTVCLGCGTVIKTGEVISRLEHTHSFSEWTVTREATLDNEGVERRECSCGEFEERSIPKLISSMYSSVGNITISSDSGFSANTVLTVMDVSENIGSVLNGSAVNKAVANIAVVGENAKILSAFDISLLLDGKKVQPNGMVKVKIPMPENSDRYEQLTVVYIEDDGSVTKLVTTVTDDGMFEFETDHFSLYAIVGVSRSNAFNPLLIIIPALVIFLAVGTVIIVTIRKKKAQ